jgi:hypothetical protein
MNSKLAKRIRKSIGFDVKKERTYNVMVHKTELDSEGNPKICGIQSNKERRAYQAAKKYI